MNTRNPFQRHPSYDSTVVGLIRPASALSPSPTLSSLTPAAVPLPLPTPDEMDMETVS